MTRINIGIAVEDLTDEHLLAEHREIKRVCNRFKGRLEKKKFDDIPNQFSLGKGHELYFVTRPGSTLLRYNFLHAECLERNFKVEDYSDNWDIYADNDGKFPFSIHQTSDDDRDIIANRIIERITESKKEYFHYKGERISKLEASEKLQKYIKPITMADIREKVEAIF